MRSELIDEGKIWSACPRCREKDAELSRLREENERMQRVITGYREERVADGKDLTRLREENEQYKAAAEDDAVTIETLHAHMDAYKEWMKAYLVPRKYGNDCKVSILDLWEETKLRRAGKEEG